MKKMRLDLNALAVESFEAGAPEAIRGTVHGRTGESCTCPSGCGYCLDTDPNQQGGGGTYVAPCGATCSCQPNTCYYSCYVTQCAGHPTCYTCNATCDRQTDGCGSCTGMPSCCDCL